MRDHPEPDDTSAPRRTRVPVEISDVDAATLAVEVPVHLQTPSKTVPAHDPSCVPQLSDRVRKVPSITRIREGYSSSIVGRAEAGRQSCRSRRGSRRGRLPPPGCAGPPNRSRRSARPARRWSWRSTVGDLGDLAPGPVALVGRRVDAHHACLEVDGAAGQVGPHAHQVAGCQLLLGDERAACGRDVDQAHLELGVARERAAVLILAVAGVETATRGEARRALRWRTPLTARCTSASVDAVEEVLDHLELDLVAAAAGVVEARQQVQVVAHGSPAARSPSSRSSSRSKIVTGKQPPSSDSTSTVSGSSGRTPRARVRSSSRVGSDMFAPIIGGEA